MGFLGALVLLAAALGGLDMLVFTGGIGEHAASIRAEVCESLAYLGIAIDSRRNDGGEDTISSADSPTLRVWMYWALESASTSMEGTRIAIVAKNSSPACRRALLGLYS